MYATGTVRRSLRARRAVSSSVVTAILLPNMMLLTACLYRTSNPKVSALKTWRKPLGDMIQPFSCRTYTRNFGHTCDAFIAPQDLDISSSFPSSPIASRSPTHLPNTSTHAIYTSSSNTPLISSSQHSHPLDAPPPIVHYIIVPATPASYPPTYLQALLQFGPCTDLNRCTLTFST
jgi:hypothetical protein